MIDAQEAVAISRKNFETFYKSQSVAEVLLEELDLSDDEKFWLVTYSFDWQPTSGTSSIGPGDRRYKVIKLARETGSMLSMKSPDRMELGSAHKSVTPS